MKATLCSLWLLGLVTLVAALHGGSHHHGKHGDHHSHGGGSVLNITGTQPKRMGMEIYTTSSRSKPINVIAFNSDRYGEWSDWSDCIKSDCIEERHRECKDDSWKEPIMNRLLTTKCLSRYYVEKRTCTDPTVCGGSGLPSECGIRPSAKELSMKIIGGKTSKPHSWPWAVRLSIKYPGQRPALLCGGTLIAPNWILTAAHCLVRSARNIPVGEVITLADYVPGVIYAHLGDHVADVKEKSQRDIRVTKASIHPTYHKTLMTDGYDFALLYLSEPANMTVEVGSACLPDKDTPLPPGAKCYAVGWGNTKAHGGPTFENFESFFETLFPLFPDLFQRPSLFPRPFTPFSMRQRRREWRKRKPERSELREVEIPIVDTEVCEKHYEKLSEHLHICAGAKGKDTCEGDSGGGLYCKLPGSDFYYVAGITSFGIHRGCGRYPGIYTSVQAHLDWLQQTISKPLY